MTRQVRQGRRAWVAQALCVAVALGLLTASAPSSAQSRPSIVVAIPNDLNTIDPHRISSASDDNLFSNVLEKLYGHDPDGNLTPQLAQSVTISDDGLTYDFKLREGVTFHNGNDFTAEDVVYSVERGLDPKIVNPRASVTLKNIASMEIVDKHRVRMRLKIADSSTLDNMEGTFYILDKEYMTEGEAARIPIGTGPFKYTGRKIGEWFKLTVNEKYWGQAPQIGEVTMRIVPDSQARFAMVQTGEADIVASVPAFIAKKEQTAKDYHIIRAAGFVNIFMHMNSRGDNPDLKKPEVRKAFNMAVDKVAIHKAITLGYATLHEGAPCGPAIFGCDQPPPSYGYNPAAAKKMLQDANFDFSRTINITAPASGRIPGSREAAEAIAYSLQQIGVKVKLTIKEYGAWMAEDQQAKRKDPATDLVISQFPDYNVNPAARLRRSLMTDGVASWFSDPELDKMIDTLNAINNDQERLDYARKMWARIHDLAPSIFLWSFDTIYGARNSIAWKPQFGSANLVVWNVVKK
jgi:peptide/nickel transport system substrate-binding protein